MAKLKHLIEYTAVRILAFAAQLLSPQAANRFGSALGTFVYHLATSRRRISNDNIRSTIGKSWSEDEIEALTKKVFQNIGKTLIEVSRFQKLTVAGALKIVTGDSGLLGRIELEGNGAIFLVAHFGNWELSACWPGIIGLPVNLLVGTQHNLLVDEMLNDFRKQMNVGVIPLDRQTRAAFKILKSKGMVVLAADQHAPAGIAIDFLGRPALHPRGPALFSIRTGAPICPFLIRRERYDKHIIITGTPIYPPNSGDEEKDIRTMTEAYVRFYEEYICRNPEQWTWTHRRWKLQTD